MKKIPSWYKKIGGRYHKALVCLLIRYHFHNAWTGTGDRLYDEASERMKNLLASVDKSVITLGELKAFEKWIQQKHKWVKDPRKNHFGMVPKKIAKCLLKQQNQK